jgi:GT2 family glycosyltransferase
MAEPSARPRRRDRYRALIHQLNQRYRREWERAEYLAGELAGMQRSRVWRAVGWVSRLKRALFPPPAPRYLPWDDDWQASPGPAAPPSGRVSLIIPFRDRVELLGNCLRSLRRSTYRRFEVVLVDNGSAEARTRRFLRRLRERRGVRVLDCPGPFNFSRLCNAGARQASGRYLLFLNNDTEVLTPDWLEQLLALATLPEVGAAGATLLYPDRTIQHAGIFPRTDGLWDHAHRGCPADHAGDRGELRRVRAVPAVTAACLLIRRDRFRSLGGFDEGMPLAMGDVDLCCRLRRRGLHVAITPHARLLHFESLSRGYGRDLPARTV